MVGSGECYETSQRIQNMFRHGLAISVDGGVVLPNKTVRVSPLWVRRQDGGFWLYCAFVAMLVRDLIMLCATCQSICRLPFPSFILDVGKTCIVDAVCVEAGMPQRPSK